MLLSEDQIYVKEVEHLYCLTPRLHKEATLYKLLEYENPASSMIFCNTRRRRGSSTPSWPARACPSAMLSSDLPQKKREKVMARFRERRDPPPGDDRRRLARHRHRGPVARLHLLDARLARAVHPPRRPHGPGGQERPRDQPGLRPRPDELQPAGEALPRRGRASCPCRPTRRCRSARSSASSTRLAAEGQALPLEDFARVRARRAPRSPSTSTATASWRCLLRGHFAAQVKPAPDEDQATAEAGSLGAEAGQGRRDFGQGPPRGGFGGGRRRRPQRR